MNEIRTPSRPFIVVEAGEATWDIPKSYDMRSRKVSSVIGMFRHHEHSTIMMYPLFNLTCSRQEYSLDRFVGGLVPSKESTPTHMDHGMYVPQHFVPFKCSSSIQPRTGDGVQTVNHLALFQKKAPCMMGVPFNRH